MTDVMKYRKKPIVVEAIQWDGTNGNQIAEFMSQPNLQANAGDGALIIETLEGKMAGAIDDWIIKGVNGEFYPCKPDIFEKSYDPVLDVNHG